MIGKIFPGESPPRAPGCFQQADKNWPMARWNADWNQVDCACSDASGGGCFVNYDTSGNEIPYLYCGCIVAPQCAHTDGKARNQTVESSKGRNTTNPFGNVKTTEMTEIHIHSNSGAIKIDDDLEENSGTSTSGGDGGFMAPSPPPPRRQSMSKNKKKKSNKSNKSNKSSNSDTTNMRMHSKPTHEI